MIDYKQLSQELYEALKGVKNLIDDANNVVPVNGYGISVSLAGKVLRKYEELTTNGSSVFQQNPDWVEE